jgi:Mrp family chromosome partitioning ATPase
MIRELASSFADEFYRLDRTLFTKTASERSGVFQFTACHWSEGVTSTTLAFAMFLAGVHTEKLLVMEANLRRPSLREMLNLDPGKSFVEALENSEPLESAIEFVPEYGFSITSAPANYGQEKKLSCESSLERLDRLIPQLRETYPCILLDTPPVIPFIDSTIVSSMTDGVILVVESNLTRAQVVDHGTEKLRSAGAKIVGIILNKREFHIPKWIYRFL